MYVRSSYEHYTERVDKFFKALLAKVSHLQFYTGSGAKGGPIIMVQVSDQLSVVVLGIDGIRNTKSH